MNRSKTRIFILNAALYILPPAVFFLFNILTPYWWDDFPNMCFTVSWDEPRERLIGSLSDMVSSTLNLYRNPVLGGNGRVFINFLQFLFCSQGDKFLFNVLNTAVYGLFVFLICWHGTGAVKKVSVPLYVTVNLALWIFAPRWGQNFLWLTGSLNYLWSLTLALLFLVPYRRTFEDPSYRMPLAVSVLFFIPGLINGWNMQNLSAGIIIALCCYFVLKLIKKERCRLFEITGAAGLLTGFLFLAGSSQLSFPGPGTLLFRLAGITVNFVIFCGFLAALFALLVIESVFSRKVKPDLLSLGYALIALASFYAMVLGFSSRAVVCPVVFFLIGIISVGRTYESVFSRYRRRLFLLAALFSVPSLLSGGREILKGYLLSRGRERHIALQREAGVLDAVVKTSIPVGDTHSALYDGGDVWVYTREIPYNLEEYHVHNGAMALFYRVRSINGLGTQPRTNVNAAIKEFLKKRKGEDLGIEDLFTFVYEQWGK